MFEVHGVIERGEMSRALHLSAGQCHSVHPPTHKATFHPYVPLGESPLSHTPLTPPGCRRLYHMWMKDCAFLRGLTPR